MNDDILSRLPPDLLCFPDLDGRPAFRIGLIATVYFEHGHTRPVREAVTEIVEAYLDKYRDEIKWAKHPKTAHMHPITSPKIRALRVWLPDHPDGEEWEFGYHGDENPLGAATHQIKAYSPNNVRPDPGYLRIHLPLDFLTRQKGSLVDVLLPICKRLRPISGYAGLGVLEPCDLLIAGRGHVNVRKLGERFPGLEIESVVTCNHVGEGIKGINWLTVLSDRWIEALGGLDYLRIRLDEPTFPFHRYDGGVIIQAGPMPQMGDAAKNLWPQPYVTLAKVLKKIQIKEHYAFHFGTPSMDGKMDKAASEAWLFRFDGK